MQGVPIDPRTVITPDAFEVSKDLLGLPLALPVRRGAATLVDLAIIGVITLVTRDIGAIVGILVAVVFVRMALRSPITKDLPAPLAWAFKFSVGCLGMVILMISFITILWIRADPDLSDLPVALDGGSEEDAVPVSVGDLVGGLQGGLGLMQALDAEQAESAATQVAGAALAAGVDPERLVDLLEQMTPDDASWSNEADGIYERAIAAAVSAMEPEEEAPATADPSSALDTISPEGALVALAQFLQSEEAASDIDPDVLRMRAIPAVAGDTLGVLESELRSATRESEQRADEVATLEARIEDLEQGSGLVRLARSVVDQLGLAFGWGSIYFAVLLPWWKGQTPGKRLMGVRVLRLDGEPINWWLAFERAGGYAAGFATGLLGFAQVYWDPNRQGIHDKIAGTVVVLDGAPRVTGKWEQAMESPEIEEESEAPGQPSA